MNRDSGYSGSLFKVSFSDNIRKYYRYFYIIVITYLLYILYIIIFKVIGTVGKNLVVILDKIKRKSKQKNNKIAI